jgi:hypothetical protein
LSEKWNFQLKAKIKAAFDIFQAGSMFGHARIKVSGATRTACAVTHASTLMLTVDRGIVKIVFTSGDYMRTNNKRNQEA